jgi:hypothetical protein
MGVHASGELKPPEGMPEGSNGSVVHPQGVFPMSALGHRVTSSREGADRYGPMAVAVLDDSNPLCLQNPLCLGGRGCGRETGEQGTNRRDYSSGVDRDAAGAWDTLGTRE